jgi:hypothetical protein
MNFTNHTEPPLVRTPQAFMPDNHPELFPYVLLSMAIISLQCYVIPFIYTVRVRAKVFNKDFMLQFYD